MSKYKILYIHHAIGLGGAPRSLSFLISHLNLDIFKPIVAMPKRSGNEAVRNLFLDAGADVIEEQDIRPFNGSTVAPCQSIDSRLYALLFYQSTRTTGMRLIEDIQPNVVHLNSTCVVAVAEGAKRANPAVKTVAHVREPLLPNWWGRNLARMNRKYIDSFISIDKYGLFTIGDSIKQSVVIPNFCDLKKYHPQSGDRINLRRGIGLKNDDVAFLFLARVFASNGALEFLEILSHHYRNIDCHAKFLISGFNKNLSKYEQKVKLLADRIPSVTSLDFVSDVISLIASADVVISPFLQPHNSRAVIEGAAMGKPALVSSVPNLEEQIAVGKSGLLFRFSQPIDLIEKINILVADRAKLQEMGKEARKFAEENYDARINVTRTMQVYQDLLDQ